jgi:ribosomal protein S27E
LALERESRVEKQPGSDSAVQQKALVVDISRALGLDFEKKNNRSSLSEQLRLMRKELPDCKHECELELLKTVARLLESLVVEPEFVHRQSTSDIGENEPLPPFEAFLCPLTKQVRPSVRTQIIRAMCQDCSFPVSYTTSHTTVFCKTICEYLQLSPGGKKKQRSMSKFWFCR